MTIGSISSTNLSSNNPLLLKKLEANGLSADKATLVENDLADAQKVASTNDMTAGSGNSVSVRAALDQKIDADVSSGKLSKSDAAAVKATLDQIDGDTSTSDKSGQTTTAGSTPSTTTHSAAAAPSGGGGGGGGGSSTDKTELSETVTISGSIKTTVITYTDGTSSTTTAQATDADEAKYGKKAADGTRGSKSDGNNSDADSSSGNANVSAATRNYLATIAPGTLVNRQI